jgi:exodeoxyribonuclease X
MTVLRVIDIETTGLAPPAEIIEIGRIDLIGTNADWALQNPWSCLYRPLNGIPPETKAVHHITETMVAAADPCGRGSIDSALFDVGTPDVLVAHNCAFERTFISDEVTGGLPWICTYKCALRLWAEAPGHSNQVLRYWRRHVHTDEDAMPPHRALPDAYVTAHLLWDMLKMTGVEQLVQWSSEPKLLPRVPFGKHKGLRWSEVPVDYLQWMTRQADMESDVVWCARQELALR